MREPTLSSLRSAFLLAALLALAGCATFSPDGGIDRVQTLARERIGDGVILPRKNADLTATSAATRELLATPLTVEHAVQVALLNNVGLRANLSALAIGEADLIQAGRLPNPHFTFSNKRSVDSTSIDRTVVMSVLSLLTIPLATEIAGRQYETLKLQVASDVVQLAGAVRRAYFIAVAAQESVKYFEQVKLAAEASNELAKRMAKIGNFNKLTQMREQLFYAEAMTQLARAKLAAVVERERLTRSLGLSGADAVYELPERLPNLPERTLDPVDAERTALDQRLDVMAAKRGMDAVAANLGLTRATRFINVVEAGYTNESNSGEKRRNGYEIDIQIPLFDWGDARLARAEAIYMQSVYRLQNAALTAQSEVRAGYHTYRASYDLARHYRDEVVPLRKRIGEENLLRYNGMLISVFELLTDAREQVVSVNAYIEALRDFWIAETDFQLALSGTSPEGGPPRRGPMMTGASASEGH